MALISYKEWRAKQDESTAFKRARREQAFGLRPKQADFMSHSTPAPWEMEKLNKKPKKKSKKKR